MSLDSDVHIPSIRVVCCGDSAVGKSQMSSRLAATQLVLDDNDFTVALDVLVGDEQDDDLTYDPTVGV
jgi:hypothetical protein